MKIGIDARFLTHPQLGGFKTYTKNLIAALASLDSENEYVLYLDRMPTTQDQIPNQKNFTTKIISGEMPILGVPWREQVALVYQLTRDRVDVFHSPCLTAPLNLSCPLVITIHDMIWASQENFTSKQSWSIKRRLIDWYDYVVPWHAARKASIIVTVSQNSKAHIVERLGVDEEKIVVTYEAAGPEFRHVSERASVDAVRQKYNLPPSFILALGAADPRKNIEALIHAYASIAPSMREKHPLVIVWTHPFLTNGISKLVESLGIKKNIWFLREVPNVDLAMLYNAATLFVFPSRHEGFGLPLLEAMACGVPVIAANNSSIPEIAGDAAVYFNAMEPQTITNVMTQILQDENAQSVMVQKGLAHAKTFSWERCARETLQVYTGRVHTTSGTVLRENLSK